MAVWRLAAPEGLRKLHPAMSHFGQLIRGNLEPISPLIYSDRAPINPGNSGAGHWLKTWIARFVGVNTVLILSQIRGRA